MTQRRFTIKNFEAKSVALFGGLLVVASVATAQVTAPKAPAAAGTTPAAASGGADPKMMEVFDRADKNGDGKLSKAEAESLPAVSQRFDQIDTDKDGSISKKEFEEAVKP
jgi:hypothetical protein